MFVRITTVDHTLHMINTEYIVNTEIGMGHRNGHILMSNGAKFTVHRSELDTLHMNLKEKSID